MTKRADAKGRAFDRDPNGWYVEPRSCVNQLADAVDFGDDLIYDPACGGGNVLDVMAQRGHLCVGSDIVERARWGSQPFRFERGDFLCAENLPSAPDRATSIISNPPYNQPERGIAERFILRAISLGGFRLAAFIVPIEFACGQGRYKRLYSQHKPSHVCFYAQRPSMPPGEALLAFGEAARGGGMADYCAVVFNPVPSLVTEAIFLSPTTKGNYYDPRHYGNGTSTTR